MFHARPSKAHLLILTVSLLFVASTAEARNYGIRGEHELSGGIGFGADLSYWTPGGFKWFNGYSYHLAGITWINFQLNVTAGGHGRCGYDNKNRWVCDDRYRSFGGTGLEMVAGAKFKWRLRTIPLQFHAKIGGALEMIWFGSFYGVGVAARGGGGARYFVLPTLGVGGELMLAMGPAFMGHDIGVEFFGTIDLNIGVEWRF